ncbi:MAG: hypothetical protein FJ295_09200 [Planctomycetes bacterium]|nr:hypothetical protein [Planctomycetota bacterium]
MRIYSNQRPDPTSAPQVTSDLEVVARVSSDRLDEAPAPGVWPQGTEFLRIALVTDPPASADCLDRFEVAGRKAVVMEQFRDCALAENVPLPAPVMDDRNWAVIKVPHESHDNQDLILQLQAWSDTFVCHEPGGPVRSILLTMQGASILYRPGWIAVVADADRLPTVTRAILEAAYFESELCCIESSIDGLWNNVQADAAAAFEFGRRQLSRRGELAERFQSVFMLRMRLARLAPHVHVPHVFPPTLASQIAERLRERTRMVDRLELASNKLVAQEQVYEMCSHRVNEYVLTRRGHLLEWGIIAILLAQSALWIYELIASSSR